MEYVTPFLWAAISLLCISRFRFFNVDGLSKKWVYTAFIFRALLGLSNFWIWQNVIGHGDSLWYFSDSKVIYGLLWKDPLDYLHLVFGYSSSGHFPPHLQYVSELTYYSWDKPEYTMVRINALLNIFTFGSAWGNIVILSFVSFAVLLSFFKSLISLFESNKMILYAVIFAIPSLVFWSSGLLKEEPSLILFCVIAIQLFHLEKTFSYRRILFLAIASFILFLIRDYLLILLLPNFVFWYVAVKIKIKPVLLYSALTLIIVIAVVIPAFVNAQFDSAAYLPSQQQYFLISGPDPDYHFQILNGTMRDVLRKIPYALNNIFFRPNFIKSTSLFRIYESFELLLVWLFILFCLFRRKMSFIMTPTLCFLLFISGELLFVYGLIVTDADTLSRYRTVPFFFILVIAAILLRPAGKRSV